MRTALLTLGLVCAAPARADVAVPQPATKKTWADACAARIDAAAKKLEFPPGAQASVIPLRREDGTPNPVQYVQYGFELMRVVVGDESERRPDARWKQTMAELDGTLGPSTFPVWFRRSHNRFGKLEGDLRYSVEHEFKLALDDCLKMGESK